MSSNIYFHKITPASCAATVNIDELGYETGWVRDDGNQPAWTMTAGTHVTLSNRTIDIFAAGEDICGKRPNSISMNPYTYEETFRFDDGSAITVSRDELEPYFTTEVFDGYVFNQEEIGHIDGAYMVPQAKAANNQQLSSEQLEKWLEAYLAENEEELSNDYGSSHYYQPLYALTKAMFEARSSIIVCNVS